MKTSIILSFLFIIIGVTLGYMQYNDNQSLFTVKVLTGILFGMGIGLFLGSIIGYTSKSQLVKEKNKLQKKIKDTLKSPTDSNQQFVNKDNSNTNY